MAPLLTVACAPGIAKSPPLRGVTIGSAQREDFLDRIDSRFESATEHDNMLARLGFPDYIRTSIDAAEADGRPAEGNMPVWVGTRREIRFNGSDRWGGVSMGIGDVAQTGHLEMPSRLQSTDMGGHHATTEGSDGDPFSATTLPRQMPVSFTRLLDLLYGHDSKASAV